MSETPHVDSRSITSSRANRVDWERREVLRKAARLLVTGTGLGLVKHFWDSFAQSPSPSPSPQHADDTTAGLQAAREAQQKAIEEEERKRFIAKVDALIPPASEILNIPWHNDISEPNRIVSPPIDYLDEISRITVPVDKFRLALRRCAVWMRRTDGTIGSSPRWRNGANCNLYAQALAQMLTYKIGQGGGGDLRISHVVDQAGNPQYITNIYDAGKLKERKQSELDAATINNWFIDNGRAYGWNKITGTEKLCQALDKGDIIYGIKTYADKSKYTEQHNWILFKDKEPIVTQATRNVYMERRQDVSEKEMYKYDPWKYPPNNGINDGGPKVSMWAHKIITP